MNPPPEINVNPIRYYQVTSKPRQEKVYPPNTSKGLPAPPLKSEMLTWYTYVRVKVYPNRVQLSCTQIGYTFTYNFYSVQMYVEAIRCCNGTQSNNATTGDSTEEDARLHHLSLDLDQQAL